LNLLDTQENPLLHSPAKVVAYHGCERGVAEAILQGTPFLPSLNGYDWLGAGIYFWEYAPVRAKEWGEKRFGTETAVLQAKLTLGNSLNLLDTTHFSGLQQVYNKTIESLTANGISIPRNQEDKRHYLDRMIVEFYCQDRYEVTGRQIQTVRGCFPEGSPVFEGSKILRETHVQIAVRDPSCISEIRLVGSE